jgi:hypothetical protein
VVVRLAGRWSRRQSSSCRQEVFLPIVVTVVLPSSAGVSQQLNVQVSVEVRVRTGRLFKKEPTMGRTEINLHSPLRTSINPLHLLTQTSNLNSLLSRMPKIITTPSASLRPVSAASGGRALRSSSSFGLGLSEGSPELPKRRIRPGKQLVLSLPIGEPSNVCQKHDGAVD